MRLKIDNISKSFNGVPVLKNFSAEISVEVTVLTGISGAGKTTLVNILAGLLKADTGSVKDFERLKKSVVFQEDRLIEEITALENVRLAAKNKVRFEELFEMLYLTECMTKKAKELSGGMKRRLALARALAADFDILILDEPFKGLDYELKLKIMAIIKKVGEVKPVILIAHENDEIDFFDRKINLEINR